MKMNHHSPNQASQSTEDGEPLGDIYRFLALAMRYPEAEVITTEFLDSFETLLAGLAQQTARDDVRQWRQKAGRRIISDLQIAYTRLFINAIPRVIAPPFASVYMDGDGSLQGPTTEKTRDWYRQQGFDIKDPSIPADHISYELEFLAELVNDGRTAEEERFLATMFRPWFVQFQQRMLADPGHVFYRTSVWLIDFFTKEEQ